MNALGQAYFWMCAVVALFGAIAAVAAKNPIRGVMGLLATVLAVGGLFLALHAHFLAAIQLIVYAGAIVVLFLFVIMLLGPSAATPSDQRGKITRFTSAGLFAGLALAAMSLVVRSAPADAPKLADLDGDFGSVDAFGRIVFTEGLVPFELSSVLLLVAIVGAVAVARGKGERSAGKASSTEAES